MDCTRTNIGVSLRLANMLSRTAWILSGQDVSMYLTQSLVGAVFPRSSVLAPFLLSPQRKASYTADMQPEGATSPAHDEADPEGALARSGQRLSKRHRLAPLISYARNRLAGRIHRRGEYMRETGILSIIRSGPTLRVRYASFNPYDMDRRTYQCSDENAVVTLLHHCEIDAWSLQQALATLRKGEVVVLPVALSEAQLQIYFPPQHAAPCYMDASNAGDQVEHLQTAAPVRRVDRPRASAAQ
jgi:hypothetical protein